MKKLGDMIHAAWLKAPNFSSQISRALVLHLQDEAIVV